MSKDVHPAPLPIEERHSDRALDRHTWTPLRYLNLYRLALGGLFVLLAGMDIGPRLLGQQDPNLFITTSVIYLAAGFVNVVTIYLRVPTFSIQVYSQILVDFVVITLLMHASGGITSGLGMLFVVAIAGGSLLTVGRTAMAFAASASLFVLLEEIYAQLEQLFPTTHYTQAGLLGVTFFATATLAHLLAKRVRESEELAARRGTDLAFMEQLAEYVIERMQTGIMILDGTGVVKLANDSARHLLGLQQAVTDNIALPEALLTQLAGWLDHPAHESRTFRALLTGADLLPRFARISAHPSGDILVFLEDTAATAQQAQQMKLASLGRLTASIAHEIRNPLGAISHAGQLLAESPGIGSADQRLTEIIRDQSKRMNTIIENILRLSRRGQAHPEEFELKPWLVDFLSEFTRSRQIDPKLIRLNIHPADIRVRIDRTQLHQILLNLCENGFTHSQPIDDAPRLTLEGGFLSDSNNPFLAVIDNGQGIAPDIVEHMFEPFFTTRSSGTGLGLYIARELCEANQARLSYAAAKSGGSCFRVTFADPRRRQVA
ncbi:MAG: two-component system NtrC family sensor histidine kinase PilS [Gammaproteobacteria bacterium]|nr:MAG: two-component system NtrC family sensor histidine kinase PilS [Gammaproteobacteria bacterium]TND03653.1 MAG: two-component system, NtrC family, sensor histidine kinase PilS [Gammaproteobacteria bacterium]